MDNKYHPQIILAAPTSSHHHHHHNNNNNNTSHFLSGTKSCHAIWNYQQARFEPCFLPIISILPGFVATFVLILRVLRPAIRRRPLWLRNFVEEEDEKPLASPNSEGKTRLRIWLISLLSLCAFGLTLDFIMLLWPSEMNLIALLPTISWATVILLVLVDKPAAAPMNCLTILLSIAITQLVVQLNDVHAPVGRDLPGMLSTISCLGAIGLILNQPLRDPYLPSADISAPFAVPSSKLRSPEDKLTPWQFMTVSWMSPLMSVGSKRKLEDEDVWSLAREFQHSELHSRFRDLKGSVVVRLLKANGLDLIIITLLALIESATRFASPTLLQLILRAMEDEATPMRAAVVYAFIALILRLIKLQAQIFSTWYGRRCYERSRGEMITMLHEKVLARKIVGANPKAEVKKDDDQDAAKSDTKKSAEERKKEKEEKEKQPASIGKILNLMKSDVYEVSQRFWSFESFVTTPLDLVLSVVLVWRLIGWPALFGVITVVIAQILNIGVTRILLRWERVRRTATDKRLQKSSQFVEAIRHLRWYGWQEHWLKEILDARQEELRQRVKTRSLGTLISFINVLASYLFPVVAFYAYTAWAHLPLRIDIAFPALQLFQYLEWNLRDIPDQIIILLHARIAMRRIEGFMNEPDRDDDESKMVLGGADTQLEVVDGSFSWPGKEDHVLKNINVKFERGLNVILGEVGSGKTALLEALLGEMDTSEGKVMKPDTMFGYCVQSPWLQSMSIRDNILFSAPFVESRYKDVLEACQLNPDLESFKDGDRSLIGENGIGLSGGQRARVALARAVYSYATILLLDDPLSALDHQTADLIVKRCFQGPLMEGRTLVLVTHRVDLVQDHAQQLIEIKAGQARKLDQSTGLAELSRILSHESSNDQKPKEEDGEEKKVDKFIEDENRVHGGVKLRVYWEYIKAGKLKYWALSTIVMVIAKFFGIYEGYFLKEWGEAYDRPLSIFHSITTTSARTLVSRFFNQFPNPEADVMPWLWAFFALAMARSIIYLISYTVSIVITYSAGRTMFQDIMQRVSHATFRFYDVTPIGRLMNRLTSDIGTVDGGINHQLRAITFYLITWLGSVLVIASVTPIFLAFSIVLSLSFVYIFHLFLPTSQSLRRLEMVSLSPLMSNFGNLLTGLTTVRAFRSQSRFQSTVITTVDSFQKQDHFFWSLQMWLTFRFDTLSALSTFLLTLLALSTGVSPGLTAFVLAAASLYVMATHGLCKLYGNLQMDFVSVERIVELLHLDQEPPGTLLPPAAWPPQNADIEFHNVTLRYAPHLPPALQNINLTIPAGKTTALLGRTGSGKSTLALSLLATLVPETGSITIGGIDLAEVDKTTLRSRITFLAQDPVLFPGSIHMNLDPLLSHPASEIASILDTVCPAQNFTPETMVTAGGGNLSQGQRQLVGLCRAVLRRSSVLIMDEATASVDAETAREVQRVLRGELRGATVLVIAHRVEAVGGVEGWVRLEGGKVVGEGIVEGEGGLVGRSSGRGRGN